MNGRKTLFVVGLLELGEVGQGRGGLCGQSRGADSRSASAALGGLLVDIVLELGLGLDASGVVFDDILTTRQGCLDLSGGTTLVDLCLTNLLGVLSAVLLVESGKSLLLGQLS